MGPLFFTTKKTSRHTVPDVFELTNIDEEAAGSIPSGHIPNLLPVAQMEEHFTVSSALATRTVTSTTLPPTY